MNFVVKEIYKCSNCGAIKSKFEWINNERYLVCSKCGYHKKSGELKSIPSKGLYELPRKNLIHKY